MPIGTRHYPTLFAEGGELDGPEVDRSIQNLLLIGYALQEDVEAIQDKVAGAIRRGEIAEDDEATSVDKVAQSVITTVTTVVGGAALVNPVANVLPYINSSLELDGFNAPLYDPASQAFTVVGAIGGQSTLIITGAVTFSSTLSVAGLSSLGATTVSTTLGVTGATTLSSTLAVTGAITGQGVAILDVTDPEALLVRKDADGGDVFIVDTTNDEVEVIGTLVVTGGQTMTLSLAFGATPATAGFLRMPNNSPINWRDTGDTANVPGVNINASDQLELRSGAGATIILQPGGTTKVEINPDGDMLFSGTDPTYMFDDTLKDWTKYLFGGDHVSGGASNVATSMALQIGLTGAPGDTASLSQLRFFGNITTQATDTITDVATLIIPDPLITLGGGASITDAASLTIIAAPTEGVTNNALLIKSGSLEIRSGALNLTGALNHDGTTIGFFSTVPAVQAAAYTRNAAIVEDRTLLASASATIINNNNVLAALIADLQSYGLLQ